MGDEEKPLVARGTYSLPEELARHAPRKGFSPDELRGACHEAGEELGREDARKATFRTAAQMVEMWRGLDLPAWQAPYVLRDARLGYLKGYEKALLSGDMSERQISHAAESRWGERWRERLRSARERSGQRRSGQNICGDPLWWLWARKPNGACTPCRRLRYAPLSLSPPRRPHSCAMSCGI